MFPRRNKVFYDRLDFFIVIFVGSFVATVLFGVAVGNAMRGLPLDERGDFTGTRLELHFIGYELREPMFSVQECFQRDMTYSAPLYVRAQLTVKETGEIMTGVFRYLR